MSTQREQASALFMRLLPQVERYTREKRMAREDVPVEEIRRASDMDLATRLRLKREGKTT